MSGFGRRSAWYLNALNGGAEEVQIGGARFRPELRELGEQEAVRVVAEYERRNRLIAPVVRAVLSRLAGFRYDGSAEARRRLVGELPLLALRDGGHDGGDEDRTVGGFSAAAGPRSGREARR
jgi:hypothetical protein